MQNPPKSQFFVRARALQYSRLRSAGHTKCNFSLRAQIKSKYVPKRRLYSGLVLGLGTLDSPLNLTQWAQRTQFPLLFVRSLAITLPAYEPFSDLNNWLANLWRCLRFIYSSLLTIRQNSQMT